MTTWGRRKRVRLHLVDAPGVSLPSIEGLLVSRRRREFVIALPSMQFAVGANPVEPEGQILVVPRERVAFFEVLA